MKYAKEIQKLLCITDEQYETEYIHRYTHWCLDRVKPHVNTPHFTKELQKVMANTAINKHYTEMHDELEYQALNILAPQKPRVALPKLKELYEVMMADVFKHYSKPLIDAAKHIEIINTIHHDPSAN